MDSGPPGGISNPKATPANDRAKAWLENLMEQNVIVAVPEIADYEVRRELIRDAKAAGLAKLDSLVDSLEFIPFNRQTTLLACQLWADARRSGMPTAGANALDCDVILAAQATVAPDILHLGANIEVIVATTNTNHLSRYVSAMEWSEIS